MIDNRSSSFPKEDHNFIEAQCKRRFGIGADGLILIEDSSIADFKMLYFNADGHLGSLCGNGSRCAIAFAASLGIIKKDCKFEAADGIHSGELIDQKVSLKMNDVSKLQMHDNDYVLNTGSPHYVKFVDSLDDFNVYENGKAIRNSKPFIEEGINVNFVTKHTSHLYVRTFERGVENETLSCGTGVTAAALAYSLENKQDALLVDFLVPIQTRGGELKIKFSKNEKSFYNIFLTGPATFSFQGQMTYPIPS